MFWHADCFEYRRSCEPTTNEPSERLGEPDEPTRNEPAVAQGHARASDRVPAAVAVDRRPGNGRRGHRNNDPRFGVLPASVRRFTPTRGPATGGIEGTSP